MQQITAPLPQTPARRKQLRHNVMVSSFRSPAVKDRTPPAIRLPLDVLKSQFENGFVIQDGVARGMLRAGK